MSTMTIEMQTLKSRLRATWMAGDYGHFARYLEAGAIEFLSRLPIQRGTRMLDVACGAGQISIPAARSVSANVTIRSRRDGPPAKPPVDFFVSLIHHAENKFWEIEVAGTGRSPAIASRISGLSSTASPDSAS